MNQSMDYSSNSENPHEDISLPSKDLINLNNII